jgi:hypothetical protein
MQSALNVRLPEALKLRVPAGLPTAIQAAARRRHMSPPEWARQVLLQGLRAEGLRLGDDGELEQIGPEAGR